MRNIFKQKPKYSISVGNNTFIADFYVDEKNPNVKYNYLHIHTPNNVFEQKIVGYPFGYLLAAVSQGNENEVHSYCIMLWCITQELYRDQGLCNDIQNSIMKWQKRKEKEAESAAKAVTDEQEQANQALMEDLASEQGLSKKELKAKREEDKEAMREVLNDVKDDKS